MTISPGQLKVKPEQLKLTYFEVDTTVEQGKGKDRSDQFLSLSNHTQLKTPYIKISEGVLVSKKSFQLLLGPNRLNDEVMNATALLCISVAQEKVEFFSTFEFEGKHRHLSRDSKLGDQFNENTKFKQILF